MNSRKRNPIFGVGINDVDYSVYDTKSEGGKRMIVWRCPYYVKWLDILKQVYSEKYSKSNPLHGDITVCKDWLKFSVFRKWMESQSVDKLNRMLNRQIMVPGSQIFSPETCIFVPRGIHNIFCNNIDQIICTKNPTDRRDFKGVQYDPRKKLFKAFITTNTKRVNLGYFNDEKEAHGTYLRAKAEHVRQVADELTDAYDVEKLKPALYRWAKIFHSSADEIELQAETRGASQLYCLKKMT